MSKLVTSRIFLMGRLRNSENGAYIAYGNKVRVTCDVRPKKNTDIWSGDTKLVLPFAT